MRAGSFKEGVMTTSSIRQDPVPSTTKPGRARGGVVRRILAVCGILSSLLYAAMVAFVATRWEGYSSASQTISDLSAIRAPTRPLWVALGTVSTCS